MECLRPKLRGPRLGVQAGQSRHVWNGRRHWCGPDMCSILAAQELPSPQRLDDGVDHCASLLRRKRMIQSPGLS